MIMQTHPHTHKPTLIATLAFWVESWRKAQGMSKQTMAALVVEAHERIGGPATTGIEFANNPDAYKRVAINCDRVYRWLDDLSKDTNHLPANMIPSVLAALPENYRIHAMNDLLRPHGLAVRHTGTLVETPSPAHLKGLVRETAEAAAAFTDLLDGATHEELEDAQHQLAEARATVTHHLEMVEGLLKQEGIAP